MALKAVTKALGLGGKKEAEEDGIWQDREIRFDTALSMLAIRPGEFQIDSINELYQGEVAEVEQSPGRMEVTTPRAIQDPDCTAAEF